MRSHEIRTVRPKCGLCRPPNRPLVLDEERENGVAIDDDESATLSVHMTKRHVARDPGHEGRVGDIDVRDQLWLDASAHRFEEGLVHARAVRSLKPPRRR